MDLRDRVDDPYWHRLHGDDGWQPRPVFAFIAGFTLIAALIVAVVLLVGTVVG